MTATHEIFWGNLLAHLPQIIYFRLETILERITGRTCICRSKWWDESWVYTSGMKYGFTTPAIRSCLEYVLCLFSRSSQEYECFKKNPIGILK